jgi:hypothetical protein
VIPIGRRACASATTERRFLHHRVYTSGQWSVGPRDAHIRATVVSDGLVVYQRGEQEPGAAGVTDARAFRRLCAGYRSSLVRSSENKEIRAGPVASEIEGGRFFIVDDGSGWADRLLANLSRTDFKSGHDDDADALAVAYDWLAIYVLSETGEGAEDAPGPPSATPATTTARSPWWITPRLRGRL